MSQEDMAGRIIAQAFNDELEKIAVDAEELSRKTLAAPNVNVESGISGLVGGGAYTFPSRKPANRLVSKRVGDIAGKIRTTSDYASKIPYYGESLSKAIGNLGGDFLQGVREAQNRLMRENPGKIGLNPGVLSAMLPAMAGQDRPLSEAGKKALMGAIASHELSERKVSARDVAPIYSHISPGVLLKEHNTVSRLTGEGADEAREVMRNLRRNSGESAYMSRLVGAAIPDPRAQQFLAEGEKVPKAMRKRILQRIRENPEIINQPESILSRMSRLPTSTRTNLRVQRALMEYLKTVK